jgi:DNA-directed RNA polymerase subunit RPC12/RpoP
MPPLNPCAACGRELNELWFECTGCSERFCSTHQIKFDEEICCPDCAIFWAQDMKRKIEKGKAQ